MPVRTKDRSMEQYTVLKANSFPIKTKPTPSSSVLMMSMKMLGVKISEGIILPRISERPLTPPVEKLLGNLKKYVPTEVMRMPAVKRR